MSKGTFGDTFTLSQCLRAISEIFSPLAKYPSNSFEARGLETFLEGFVRKKFLFRVVFLPTELQDSFQKKKTSCVYVCGG